MIAYEFKNFINRIRQEYLETMEHSENKYPLTAIRDDDHVATNIRGMCNLFVQYFKSYSIKSEITANLNLHFDFNLN